MTSFANSPITANDRYRQQHICCYRTIHVINNWWELQSKIVQCIILVTMTFWEWDSQKIALLLRTTSLVITYNEPCYYVQRALLLRTTSLVITYNEPCYYVQRALLLRTMSIVITYNEPGYYVQYTIYGLFYYSLIHKNVSIKFDAFCKDQHDRDVGICYNNQ